MSVSVDEAGPTGELEPVDEAEPTREVPAHPLHRQRFFSTTTTEAREDSWAYRVGRGAANGVDVVG